MQIDWVQLVLVPFAVGVSLLGVEYFGIQGLFRRRETEVTKLTNLDSYENQRKWSSAIKKAVDQFKEIPLSYNWKWYAIRQNFVTVSGFSADDRQAQLTLEISEKFLLSFTKPKIVARYMVPIGRSGHIYRYDVIPLGDEASDDSLLPFPFSWIIISIFLIAWTNAQLNKPPEGDDIVNGHLVSSLWSTAQALPVNQSNNGAVGDDEVKAYIYTGQNQEVISLTVQTFDEFPCDMAVYSINNSRITTARTNYQGTMSLLFAPELSASYLILIYPASGRGGSYTLHVSSALSPTPTP